MAHAPSGKNRQKKISDELNLVPMIDMVTNLMFFLMMFASVLPVVFIDAPQPKIAATADEVKKAKDDQNKLDVVININKTGFTVKTGGVGDRAIPVMAEGKYDYKALHEFLVQVHTKRPNAKDITLMPADDVVYEVMIEAMDAARELVNGDPGYQQVPPDIAQKPEAAQFNRMFPDVSIGGV